MPMYEYACRACDRTFEELVPISGAQDVACPGCGSTRVERLLSTFQRVRAGGGQPVAVGGRGGGCCGGGCGCGH